jgi:hypothetical protein
MADARTQKQKDGKNGGRSLVVTHLLIKGARLIALALHLSFIDLLAHANLSIIDHHTTSPLVQFDQSGRSMCNLAWPRDDNAVAKSGSGTPPLLHVRCVMTNVHGT